MEAHNETFINGVILNLSTIIKYVVASASEAEIAALFYNYKQAVPLKVTLKEMGHQQPCICITTDNSTMHGLITKSMIPKAAKAMDMQFYWLKSW